MGPVGREGTNNELFALLAAAVVSSFPAIQAQGCVAYVVVVKIGDYSSFPRH